MFLTKIGHGIVAGAVGVTTLNAVTYLDMSIRARPASDAPSKAVQELTEKAGAEIPGDDGAQDNRLAGLGPLAGILTGVTVGVAAAFARPALGRIAAPLAAVALGALAMAGADGPLVALGLTKPSEWSVADWASDIIPHACYGVAAYATLAALEPALPRHG
jgi:hypothetical protein